MAQWLSLVTNLINGWSLLVLLRRPVVWGVLLAATKLSHTPYSMPVYFIVVACMVYLWRGTAAPKWAWLVLLESILLGMISCWLVTLFFWFSNTWAVCGLCYAVSSTHTVAMALALWWSRSWNLWRVAPLVGAVVAVFEWLHACLFGITWIVTNAALTVAATPIAQWTAWLTPFGLSAVIVALGCLYLPVSDLSGYRRWIGTGTGLAATCTMWLVGAWTERQVFVAPLSFQALMVQPHDGSPESSNQTKSENAHQWTLTGLRQAQPAIDLVLWPESALSGCSELELVEADEVTGEQYRHGVGRLRSEWLPHYGAHCLVGTKLFAASQLNYAGQSYPVLCSYNCGCLFATSGTVVWHEKLVLVPIREVIPDWLGWFPGIRRWLTNDTSAVTTYQPGRNFHPLTFEDRHGNQRRVAVAICYESWFPWLPQYHCKEPLDAICHLAYDGDFKDHPEYTQRMLLTIRLRAIETRTWQLVCSHYAGTAVIDPRGRIVKQLPPGPGVLRTDQLE
jgi:apolipoprotein N-acyltransferase